MAIPPDGGWSDENQKRAADAGYDSYESWISELEDERGGNICGCWSPNQQRPCKHRRDPKPTNPKGRCERHGANVPRGVDHYRFGTGEHVYSEMVEGVFARAYEESHGRGPDQISLDEQIALVDGLIADAVERLGRAQRESDDEAFDAAAGRLVAAADERRKLAEAERRRLEAVQDAIGRDRLNALMGALITEIRTALVRNVSDDDERRGFLADLSEALNRWADAGGGGVAASLPSGGDGGPPSGNGAGPP